MIILNQPQFLLTLFLLFYSISAIEFVFNGFNSLDILLYSTATTNSRILTLTYEQTCSIGHALYHEKTPTKKPNSSNVYPFSTCFIFAMALYKDGLPGHGMVFIFTPVEGIEGTSFYQHLGLFNLKNNGNPNNYVLGVEFDAFMNQEFDDINDNHVGINILKSVDSHSAGYWPKNMENDEESLFKEMALNDGENYQVWIEYEDKTERLGFF